MKQSLTMTTATGFRGSRDPTAPSQRPSREQLLAIVHEYMEAVYKGQGLSYREPTFRVSAFPYCPLLMASSLSYKGAEYRSDYYFGVGTAVHEMIQRWAARVGYTAELWGDWKCTGCGTTHQHCVQPFQCQRCAGNPDVRWWEWEYVEVTLQWRGLSGHVDTIFKIGPWFIVIDYKTTEFHARGGAADRNRYPYKANVIQVEIYTALLREALGIDVINWCLIYVDRTHPIKSARDYFPVLGPDWTPDRQTAMMRVLAWAAEAQVTAGEIQRRLMAGEPIPREWIQYIIDRRPCKNEEGWLGWMQPKFYWERSEVDENGAGVCPHLGWCTGCSGRQDDLDNYWFALFESDNFPRSLIEAQMIGDHK